MTENECQQLLAEKDEQIKVLVLALYEARRAASVSVSVVMPDRFASQCPYTHNLGNELFGNTGWFNDSRGRNIPNTLPSVSRRRATRRL